MNPTMSSHRKRKKQKNQAVSVVILLIIVITAAGVIVTMSNRRKPSMERISPETYFAAEGEGRIAVALTEGLLPVTAAVKDGTLYLPYEGAADEITDKVYYDPASRILTAVSPTEILNISSDGDDGIMYMDGGSVMLSMDFLLEHSDIEVQQFEDPARLVIKERFDLPSVNAVKDTVLRAGKSVKEPILCDIKAGQTLTLLSRGEEYLYCSTNDGYTGYIAADDAGEDMDPPPHEEKREEYTNISLDHPINMVFHQIYDPAANSGLLDALDGVTGVNAIAPTWFFLDDTDGTVRDLSNQSYVETAHSEGLLVFATANDFDGNLSTPEETLAVLKNTKIRQHVEDQILEGVLSSKADGICIDYEKVREDCADPYIMFIREMSVLCRNNGLIFSVCNYVPQAYNRYLGFEEQGEVADYLVIMAYDEHYSGSEAAGSVSSISWVREAVDGTKELVPAEKIIIAIPFYTRLWETVQGKNPSSTAMGMAEAEEYVTSHGMKVVWDDETKQNYAELTGTTHYEIWMEDEQSVIQKMRVISSAQVAGVAEWKLGLEDPVVWDVIESYLQ